MILVLREVASEDVDDCTGFIQRENLAAALRFPLSVMETARWLAAHPGAGHPVRVHLRLGLRSFGVNGFPNHRLFYQVEGDELVVIRVLHAARDLRRQLRPSFLAELERRLSAR